MTTRLSLVCHASTDAVRGFRFAADEPLDEQAYRKLAALTDAPRRADRVWTSPALRAQQTAEALTLRATVDPRLRDWDFGRWSGRALADVHVQEPEAIGRWIEDPGEASHGGESLHDVLDRGAAWLAAQAAEGGTVVAISHAALIRAVIVSAIAAPPQTFWHLDVAPLSVTVLSYGHARWSLAAMGPISSRREPRSAFGPHTGGEADPEASPNNRA